MTMSGLKPDTVEAIQAIFEKYAAVEKAVLYGSRARGNYRPGSDIDLMLEGEGLDLTTLQKIENDLDELFLPYKMDISLLKHIRNESLLVHIRQVGKLFYERPGE